MASGAPYSLFLDHLYTTSELLLLAFVMWGSASWIKGSDPAIWTFVHWTQLLEYWSHDTNYMLWNYIPIADTPSQSAAEGDQIWIQPQIRALELHSRAAPGGGGTSPLCQFQHRKKFRIKADKKMTTLWLFTPVALTNKAPLCMAI